LAVRAGLGQLDADTIKKTIDSFMNSGFYLDSIPQQPSP
jgi:hypothetical protein